MSALDSSLVVDLGNSTIKAGYVFGFPSDDEPRVITPAEVRQLPDGEAGQAATPPEASGNGAAPSRLAAGATVLHPIQQGVVQNWDALETLLHYVLYDELGWVEGEETNLLLADPILTSRPDRERMASLMFETFNTAGYFVSDQAVLSLYSIGKLNGIVVDIGEQTTDVAPVMEGLLLPSTCRRLPYGSRDLNRLMAKLIAARGVVLPESLGMRNADVESLKKASLRAAGTDVAAAAGATGPGAPTAGAALGDGKAAAGEVQVSHTLPDGQTFTVQREDGEQLFQALLSPSLLGMQLPTLAEVVVTAGVSYPEKDTRKALMENIFVCGGAAGAPGLSRRLLTEVRALAPPPSQPGICSVPEYMPEHTAKVAAWMGGALLAKVVFGQGQNLYISKAEYDEYGPLVVHKKCS
ncbi:hypothetical protein N2152v2_010508 [Parachlorella kessleri]